MILLPIALTIIAMIFFAISRSEVGFDGHEIDKAVTSLFLIILAVCSWAGYTYYYVVH